MIRDTAEFSSFSNPSDRMEPAASTTTEIPDLLKAMHHGSEVAWTEFHARFFPFVFRSALSLNAGNETTAADVTQEAFHRAVRHLKTNFPDEDAVRRWLHCLVRTASIDHARGQKRRSELLERFVLWLEHERPDPVACALQEDRMDFTDALLGNLPENDAGFLRAFYLEGRSHVELAGRYDISVKAVESKLARLRKKLRSIATNIESQELSLIHEPK
ncbi:MAG: sigma-70 family RNA polymerase sigma factor [Verrucomicrobiota bacterium]